MHGGAVSGSTKVVGLLGWPVAHSRSPAMHNAAFASLGLDFVYVPLPVHCDRLSEAVRGLAALGIVGANVTIPHKSAVIPFLAGLSQAAADLAAVNTLVLQADGTLIGDNTDAPGFLADLEAHGVDPAGCRALLLGAGGSARAVCYALVRAGATVAVANRTVSRAEELCDAIKKALPQARVRAHPFPEAVRDLAAQTDLVVNATSLGLRSSDELPWDAAVPFRPGQVAYDLVYLPSGRASAGHATRFLSMAAEAGAEAIDGLGMLVQQGARSFELWTGVAAPVDVMAEAAR